MARRVIRVGGVHEPFNLPWIRAFDLDAYADLGLEVTFEEFAGGTGALVEALERGTIDLATLLTEGAVTACGNGSPVQIHSQFTRSPLNWGVHVGAGAATTEVDELGDARFAVSRHGSGSELMAHVLADRYGWTLAEDQIVVVGGVDGAVAALPAGRADVFLWEKHVTAPLVAQGVFRRIGELQTPWPAFVTATRPGLLQADRPLVDDVVTVVLDQAAALVADRAAATSVITRRYGMSPDDTRAWFDTIEWPSSIAIDRAMLGTVMLTMHGLGRIGAMLPVDTFA